MNEAHEIVFGLLLVTAGLVWLTGSIVLLEWNLRQAQRKLKEEPTTTDHTTTEHRKEGDPDQLYRDDLAEGLAGLSIRRSRRTMWDEPKNGKNGKS